MTESARKQSEANSQEVQASQNSQEQGLLKQFLVGSNVVAVPFAAANDVPPARSRGRPRKPKKETPCEIPFDTIADKIKAIPPDTKDGPPGRNQISDRARATVGRDARLARSAIVIFDRLLEQIIWEKGLCRRSLSWFEATCGMERNTVARALKALERCGHIRRRRRKSAAGDWDRSETTIAALAMALQSESDEVVPKNTGVVPNKYERWSPENTGGSAELGPLASVVASADASDGTAAPSEAADATKGSKPKRRKPCSQIDANWQRD